MRVTLSALAHGATVDQQGRFTIFGIFDHYLVSEFPARLTRTSVAMQFVLEPDDVGRYDLAVRLRHDGQILRTFDGPTLNVPRPPSGQRATHNQVFNIDNLEFAAPGRYEFEILLDGEVLAVEPLILRKRDPDRSSGRNRPSVPQMVPMPPGGPLDA